MLKTKFIIFLLLVSLSSYAQNPDVVKNYIDSYKEIAMAEMQRTGVPAAITLAQGIHESGAGNGTLAVSANNHFGIKCKSTWTGESIKHDDDAKGECFRKYSSAEDSYKDHSDFLKNSPRYASLFSLDPSDYSGWAYGLKQAGYATNPKYPEALIKLIEDYNLQQYTLIALGKIKETDLAKTNTDANAMKEAAYSPVITETNIEKTTNPVNYPDGLFAINETKVVFVRKGSPFIAIAHQYDIDLSKIFEFNDMNEEEQVSKDQLIYLQRKRKTGNNEFHIVQPGETLHDIAQVEAIRIESLQLLNMLNDGEMPAAGEKLCLQKKTSKPPRLALRENYSLTGDTKLKTAN